jgi:hypothetical protein
MLSAGDLVWPGDSIGGRRAGPRKEVMAREPVHHKLIYREKDPKVEAAKTEAFHAHGENGAYKATEALARKIRLNGPEYYFGGRTGRAPAACFGPEGSQRIHCPTCGSGTYKIKFQGGAPVNTCARCGHTWSERKSSCRN